MKKRISNMIVYFIPAVVLLIGIAAYFIVIPKVFGGKASVEEWMLADPVDIIDMLLEGKATDVKNDNNDKGIQLFWRIWLAGFIASLFFFCRKIHLGKRLNSTEAIYIKREPYFVAQSVEERLKQVSEMGDGRELDSLIFEVKILEEKLSVESDFGYGDVEVIKCENDIAEELQLLEKIVTNMKGVDFEENVRIGHTAVMHISALLRKRTGLKRK